MSASLPIIDWAGKATIIMATAWVLVTRCGRCPKHRRLVWVCAFAGSLLVPLLGATWVNPRVLVNLRLASVGGEIASPSNPLTYVDEILSAVWLIGACLALAWLAAGYVGLSRATKGSRTSTIDVGELPPAGFGRTWTLRVANGKQLASPLTFGCLWPVVLLPLEAETWTREQQRAVVAHELAHVRNFDGGAIFVAYLLCALLWFNPFVWLALRAFRAECEFVADEAVAEAGLAPSTYASILLSLASGTSLTRIHAVALTMVRTPTIEGRIRAIVRAHPSLPFKLHQRLATVGLVATLVGITASFRLAAAQAPPSHSAAWQRGYELAQKYRAEQPNGVRPSESLLTSDVKQHLEQNLIRSVRPPPP